MDTMIGRPIGSTPKPDHARPLEKLVTLKLFIHEPIVSYTFIYIHQHDLESSSGQKTTIGWIKKEDQQQQDNSREMI